MRLLLLCCCFLSAVPAAETVVTAPGGALRVVVSDGTRLTWRLERAGTAWIADSPLGVTVNGVDWGADARLGAATTSQRDETFPRRGAASTGRDHCTVAEIPVQSSVQAWKLEVRAFDTGAAWRYRAVLPPGAHRVTAEASSWTLPAATTVWFFERDSDWKLKTYAGEWMSAPIERMPTVSKQGPVQGGLLVGERAGGGELVVGEAALAQWSGLRLRAVGNNRMQADATEGAAGFPVEAALVSPWRMTIAVDDLDALLRCDLPWALNPPPDPALFADTTWIRGGLAVWDWLAKKSTGTPAVQRQYLELASELGAAWIIVYDGWEKWPRAWDEIATLVTDARQRGVLLMAWKKAPEIWAPADDFATMRAYLDRCAASGVAGLARREAMSTALGRPNHRSAATAERRAWASSLRTPPSTDRAMTLSDSRFMKNATARMITMVVRTERKRRWRMPFRHSPKVRLSESWTWARTSIGGYAMLSPRRCPWSWA